MQYQRPTGILVTHDGIFACCDCPERIYGDLCGYCERSKRTKRSKSNRIGVRIGVLGGRIGPAIRGREEAVGSRSGLAQLGLVSL